jgi:cytochrome c oxidase subunit 2
MIGLITILIIALLTVVVIQIAKVTELAAKIRGEKEVEQQNINRTGLWLVVFMVGFLVYCIASAIYFKDRMLGYGPHSAASEHGGSLDSMFDITLFFTGIVFVLTHIFLFWYSYKYRQKTGGKALFFAHSTKLEIVWTFIPAIVMFFLVIKGLIVWNEVMPDVGPDDEYFEIEATGYQFAWDIRYPGADGKLGTRDFRMIDPASNPLGQDWTDQKNLDDFQPVDIVLPVNKKVRVRITSKDVLHNFYLPHFRVKMDAIPGLPTYFIFTPTKTTDEYRQGLRDYPEWQEPADPDDPEGPKRWETFDYELACAELCGKGHYSMRKIVKIVSDIEYQVWLDSQTSYYLQSVRNTDADPYKDQLLEVEVTQRAADFEQKITTALAAEAAEEKIVRLDYVEFQTGSAQLTELSKFELDNLTKAMTGNTAMMVELGGHTDNTGDPVANRTLSKQRAETVKSYLVNKGVDAGRLTTVGYGDTRPVEPNDTEDGRQNNRRTEIKIIAQ